MDKDEIIKIILDKMNESISERAVAIKEGGLNCFSHVFYDGMAVCCDEILREMEESENEQ